MTEACGDRHEPECGTRYVCTQDKGHANYHAGPCMAWTSRQRPAPASWPLDPGPDWDGLADRAARILATPGVPADERVRLARALLDRNVSGRGYGGAVDEGSQP